MEVAAIPLTRLVEELRALHFDEVVFYWPRPNRDDDFEQKALDVLAPLR